MQFILFILKIDIPLYMLHDCFYLNIMKKLSILVLPIVLALSAMIVVGNVSMNAVAQNETSSQGNQTSSQGNQTSSQGNQTSSQNQTSGQGQQIPMKMDEKLLNLTNDAIKASKDKDSKKLTSSLKAIQGALINASGKQAIFIPDTATSGSSSDKSSSSSDKSTSSSSSDSGSSSDKSKDKSK
jgi:hypothetical protein